MAHEDVSLAVPAALVHAMHQGQMRLDFSNIHGGIRLGGHGSTGHIKDCSYLNKSQ